MENDAKILYRQVKRVRAGQTERFRITYTPSQIGNLSSLWVKVKNTQLIALRAAYLVGPYVLYVDCKAHDYDSNEKYFITADQPVFEPQLSPGQSFYMELSCHTMKPSYCWVVDVVSQILFNNTIDIDFEITVATSKSILHDMSFPETKVANCDKLGAFVPSTVLTVHEFDTLDLWNLPVPQPDKPIHLVILTHGLHSNVSADMMYLKEQIDKQQLENVVVKGYFGNIGKTERGIKYLGSRVAEFIVELVTKNETFNDGKVTKISFIGHSLGGLVQTFAIAYIQVNFPWLFEQIQPVNFIALASPLLGIVNENPVFVKLALLAGIVGKTGQDIGLKFVEFDSKPLLYLLPSGPTHTILKRFRRRTVYANAINDGIVPLRTSSLLYLDYKGISELFNTTINDTSTHTGKIPNQETVLPEANNKFLVQAMLSFFMPQKHQRKPDDTYVKFQTNEPGSTNFSEFEGIPTSSVFESIPSLVLPPLPSIKYITDPASRGNIILHDKFYHEEDLPPTTSSELADDTEILSNIRKRILNTIDYDVEHLEEAIAREYHKGMSWRKVIVKLKPDAHNNIIVRRRFVNAYGWPVIAHLVNNHFTAELESEDCEDNTEAAPDSLDTEVDLASLINRELIEQENDKIEQESDKAKLEMHQEWINAKDGESFFAVGPTGLLSDVSDMVGSMKDYWYNYGLSKNSGPDVMEESQRDEPEELDLSQGIMGGFT